MVVTRMSHGGLLRAGGDQDSVAIRRVGHHLQKTGHAPECCRRRSPARSERCLGEAQELCSRLHSCTDHSTAREPCRARFLAATASAAPVRMLREIRAPMMASGAPDSGESIQSGGNGGSEAQSPDSWYDDSDDLHPSHGLCPSRIRQAWFSGPPSSLEK